MTVSDTSYGGMRTWNYLKIFFGNIQFITFKLYSQLHTIKWRCSKNIVYFSQLEKVDAELKVRNWESEVIRGQPLDLTNQQRLHPKVRLQVARQRELHDLVREFEKRVAFRPTPSKVSGTIKTLLWYHTIFVHWIIVDFYCAKINGFVTTCERLCV